MKILIILNSVVYNRGSEALIRGLSKLLKKQYSDSYITLMSSEENFGKWIDIENIDCYEKKTLMKKHSISNYINYFFRKIPFMKKIGFRWKYANVIKVSKNQDYIYMIGADNYDISYHGQERLLELNRLIRKHTNAKMVLYDCSFAEKDVTKTLKEDFKNFDCITVRESISLENLNQDVLCIPDPAFVMDVEKVELPSIFSKGNVIGINASNLITNSQYGSNANDIILAYQKMINYILEETNYDVVLIPHVMNHADLSTLEMIYSPYQDEKRVDLLDNESYNAKQLKYIISNLELFVGARTHATIAAYSQCIPTLVLGYSVKSRGIAKDLFGTEKNYVLSVETVSSNIEILKESFIWLLQEKGSIKKQLEEKIPNYIEIIQQTIPQIEKKCE